MIEPCGVGLIGRGHDALDQRALFHRKLTEDRLQGFHRHTPLVFFEEGVIRRALVAEEIGLLAEQGDHFFEVRREPFESRFLACGDPRFVGFALLAGELFDEGLGQFGIAFVVVERFGHEGPFALVQRGCVSKTAEPVAHFIAREQPVGDGGQGGQLAAAGGGGFGWHVDFLIPVEQRDGALDVNDLAQFFTQFGDARFGHGVSP